MVFKCVKCGNFGHPPAVKVKYVIYYPSSGLPSETLKVTCGNCGYVWAEKCADARDEEKGE